MSTQSEDRMETNCLFLTFYSGKSDSHATLKMTKLMFYKMGLKHLEWIEND